MKLLYLANARIPTPRAYGLQIMKTCEAFARSGIEVELVVPARNVRTPGDVFAYYGVEKKFTFTTLPVPDLLRFGSIGFLISAILFSEKARWMKSFREADVVYSRDALVLIQYLLLGRKLVFEAHARPSFVSRIVARRAYRVITISQGLKDAYIVAGARAENIVVAPDAVDEHLFDNVPERENARKELGLPLDTQIALYAGHLYSRKGADTLAAAATHLPEVRFIFVGGASDDIALFKEKWEGGANIEIVGHVPHEKIPLYLRAADVLVLPNSGKDEDSARFTSPMKLFEYMASSTPIVASDVPAIREVLDDASARLVLPDDPTALAYGINELLAHPEEAQSRAMNAQTNVARYTWQKRALAILASLR